MPKRSLRRLLVVAQYVAAIPFLAIIFPTIFNDAEMAGATVFSFVAVFGIDAFLKRGLGGRIGSFRWQLGLGLDERERQSRDRAIAITFAVTLGLVCTSFFASGWLLQGQISHAAAKSIFLLQMITCMVILTMPSAIVLWNEADPTGET